MALRVGGSCSTCSAERTSMPTPQELLRGFRIHVLAAANWGSRFLPPLPLPPPLLPLLPLPPLGPPVPPPHPTLADAQIPPYGAQQQRVVRRQHECFRMDVVHVTVDVAQASNVYTRLSLRPRHPDAGKWLTFWRQFRVLNCMEESRLDHREVQVSSRAEDEASAEVPLLSRVSMPAIPAAMPLFIRIPMPVLMPVPMPVPMPAPLPIPLAIPAPIPPIPPIPPPSIVPAPMAIRAFGAVREAPAFAYVLAMQLTEKAER
eukprot:CAMPEP_0173371796 /NCGR_PEP_ID=MMETSP1144-20121109/27494_1 /TAXON_ID=483371 /ORGANISM="non described non described, Strain CCMP2298" /LENGTH=259 /DNA_ID=CAMNT_0014323605 /DNA_START=159 /DNA_END=939 /DNA_ORIENTATION=+